MPKQSIAALTLIALTSLLIGCAVPKTIDGVEYDTFGLLNEAEKRDPKIQYEVSPGSVFLAAALSPTMIVPVYIVGFALYEPVGRSPKGQQVPQ